jgi:VIT1/CCC1 family predicted Fe2+/Mn2+ transporter
MASNASYGSTEPASTSSATTSATSASINGTNHTDANHTSVPVDARHAYQLGDSEASKLAHAQKRNGQSQQIEHHSAAGGHLKSIVYGGLDGIITTFATVTSVAGAQLSASIILILGIAHLFADGISMGMGDALSDEAEHEFYRVEKEREVWEMAQNMQGEVDEMIDEYTKRGISEADARLILTTLAKPEYKKFFLDNMMVWELGMLPMEEETSPWVSGGVTFGSFVLFGSVPLLSYLLPLFGVHSMSNEMQFYCSVGLTVLTLLLLGAIKGLLVDKDKGRWIKSAIVMAGYGCLAAAVGYVMGWFLKTHVGVDA